MFGVNYRQETEPTPEYIIYIARIEIKMEKTYRQTRIIFKGTNEKEYSYYIQPRNLGDEMIFNKKNLIVTDWAELLIIQLKNYLNKVMETNRYTLIRNIRLHTPYVLNWGISPSGG